MNVMIADYYCWRIWRWSWSPQIKMHGAYYTNTRFQTRKNQTHGGNPLDDAIASWPRIKGAATGSSLNYSN